MNFDQMGLAPQVLRAVERQGYTTATEIQSEAIPLILAGHDLLGCAQTGTGKTAAFALPTLNRLLLESPVVSSKERHPRRRPISVLVLTPTRELANQVYKSYATYGRATGMKQAVIYGGVSQRPQVDALRAGVDIVIATPGRLLDLMNQGHVRLDSVKVLVLDEADQMLDMGFIHDLKRIVKHAPAQRQTLMFSATMPPEIRSLSSQWLTKPRTVQATPEATAPEKIQQTVAFVEQKQKAATLVRFLESAGGVRHLVFCRTKRGADRVVQHLAQAKIHALAIHGNKSQRAREQALAAFSSDKPPVLVATDVAARGLHMPGVSHVINFDLPDVPETYIHRIGRTARAGASGESISFCSVDERPYLQRIERLIQKVVAVHASLSTSQPPAAFVEPAAGNTKRFQPRRQTRSGGGSGSSSSASTRRPFKPGRSKAAGFGKRGGPSRTK